jgi:transglutaminase-like putative cysteine protease
VRPPLHLLTREAKPQRLKVEHRSVYRYATPVERSTHLLRLEPMHDLLQSKLSYGLEISVDGKRNEFEDVFGNRATRLDIDRPFTELAIVGRALVEARETNPLAFRSRPHGGTAIPVVWMPWQRHMLQPYLLPPELPETQLMELTDYAMSFVLRNDSDLLETLLDLNLSIFREYRYAQGLTNMATTPFDVYFTRRGVCQDFANLFICLARLLGVPARYVCGYVYTGPLAQNQAQSEASHAWVQVYLPEVGWKGFDPTNGVVTQTDHIRVAVGRAYVDTTPTSGTIFVGGGQETLEVAVRCEPAP